MKLIRLELENYRCFPTLTLEIDEQLTLLVARNGQGKTSLLDAIKVALWPYLRGFDLGSTTNDITGIHPDDVFLRPVKAHQMEPSLPSRLTAHALFLEKEWQWSRRRESIRKGTQTRGDADATRLEATAEVLEVQIFDRAVSGQLKPFDLPVLAYYGTGRLWSQKKLTAAFEKAENAEFSRTYGYRDCLDPASSYKHFAKWYTRIFRSYREEQIRNIERGKLSIDVKDEFAHPVLAVQNAVNAVLATQTGWRDLAYSSEFADLVLEHPVHGVLKVSQLSDGIRNIVALAADIAYRCVKLNPHLGILAPRESTGVVLIDEVDMHLHPSWQQTVIPDLLGAFPCIQFIVTTHSPQVITSVPARCIRVLQTVADDKGRRVTVSNVDQQTQGVASSQVLAYVMDIDPTPNNEPAQKLSEYMALVQQDLHESAEGLALREYLDEHFGTQHPNMLDCQRLIRLETFKRKQLANK
ncbi:MULTISPECIES: AAA family ATPase [Gammaproteobacteria]|uniref:AAA family ATPase n=1 Tax=Gammaproteobacteria TaxID=1236 RepID=UPI0019146175|nr:AAA family ATPase [Bacillus sp. TH86]MBK5308806.1 AAA family ATPase [Pseudomonas sp. TH71]MBK5314266.1 AAA family ATPase [Erwinia sp. TH79]MBK5319767.1 AAA family ATPase [Bacillus sp. TH59]MBK5334717.1 AAA family ATPase [Bacillus sp. TH57]MBK5368010.1 AAA family ATPase [Pseudomonas sp. TH40]MBK5379179.1 AAA family ATPase [Pseudomonas sp. TH35]MBK5384638.1 AAA family ATPase [Pseudomonas sp. TH38]MBK5401933.1 AAA family ATPase [Pseudomonas sp. TH37]MBK5419126.1 AAA family ATPase [Erwinia 